MLWSPHCIILLDHHLYSSQCKSVQVLLSFNFLNDSVRLDCHDVQNSWMFTKQFSLTNMVSAAYIDGHKDVNLQMCKIIIFMYLLMLNVEVNTHTDLHLMQFFMPQVVIIQFKRLIGYLISNLTNPFHVYKLVYVLQLTLHCITFDNLCTFYKRCIVGLRSTIDPESGFSLNIQVLLIHVFNTCIYTITQSSICTFFFFMVSISIQIQRYWCTIGIWHDRKF